MTSRLQKLAPWAAALAIGLAAFVIGRCSASPDAPVEAAEEAGDWTCAMHPQVHRTEPGQCPICGMDLVEVSSLSGDELTPSQVALSPRARALAGIRTETVRAAPVGDEALRLSGRIEIDESSERTLTSWIGGRIDRLHARVTGQRIRRGQTVATLYSPEVYAAARDLRAAARQLERLAGGTPLARSAAEATLTSARERLRLLGIPEAEVDRMQARDTPSRRVSIRSPFSGTVIERVASEGAYVTAGAPLYRIADLSRLWVQLDAYESDLARLAVGQMVALDVAGVDAPLEGRVAFIDPVLDPRRRTARVRVEVDNPDGQLRPGMFAEARLSREGGAALSIRASAPLFTGRRSLVYVEVPERAQPTYEARVVSLGPRSGGRYPVLAGLETGERVVIEGAFALDADLQIRGGESMMAREPAPAIALDAFAPALEAYLDVQRALAEDDLEAARAAAVRVASSSADVPELAAQLTDAEAVRGASDLAAARVAFEPLSLAITRLLRALGNPTDQTLRLAFCPMSFDNRGAEWVQSADAIDNAYFGNAMRTCGSFRETFAPRQPETPGEEAPEPPNTGRRRAARPTGRSTTPDPHAGHRAPAADPHAGHAGHKQ